MGDSFSLQGSYAVTPLSTPESADFDVLSKLDEVIALSGKSADSFDLTSDSPFSVPFGSLAGAHVAIVKIISGRKVKASITTADGTDQIVPIDPLLILESLSAPITALTLTRTPGSTTSVRVFLGQKA